MNSRTRLAIAAFVVAVAALILYSTLSLGAYSCEVCMEFRGQSKCRTARGSSREEATRTATDNACAFLASGMSDGMACTNTPPKSSKCRE